LVLPIDALLSHPQFDPHDNASPELIALYRNVWFICVLFRFTSDNRQLLNEWQRAALARIATKTPPLVIESAHDYVTSDLEYNPVLRQDYLHHVGHHCFKPSLSDSLLAHSRLFLIIGKYLHRLFLSELPKYGIYQLVKLYSSLQSMILKH
jgi:hypothetical protein